MAFNQSQRVELVALVECALVRAEVFQQLQAFVGVEQSPVQFRRCAVDRRKNFQPGRRRPQNGPTGMLDIEPATLGQQEAIGQGQHIVLPGTFKNQ
ncbi:hypothetical protein ACFQD2_04765 [Pseudomonas lini]